MITLFYYFLSVSKRLIITGQLLLLGGVACAQTPAWQTLLALTNSPSSIPEVTAMTTDASGNVYLTGQMVGNTTFGNITLTSAGNGDVFVAKWRPATSSFEWAQRAGGSSLDVAEAIAVSGTSVYISGYFTSPTVAFGATTLTHANYGSTLSLNVFVAKLADVGAGTIFTWAQRGGGDHAPAVAVSGSNVYLAGYFGRTQVDFGSTVLANVPNTLGNIDAFVAKLTDLGTTSRFDWAQRAGGNSTDYIFGLAATGPNVYVTGEFSGTAAAFGTTTLSSAGQGDVFVAKLTDAGTSGTFAWAERAGGLGNDRASALAVNGTSLYAVGAFNSAPAAFGTTTVASSGSNDAFITKLLDAGTTGQFVWTQRAGGTGTNGLGDQAQSVAVSGPNVYVAGSFNGAAADFGPTILASNSTIGTLFLTQLIDAGSTSSFKWALKAGGPAYNSAVGIGVSGPSVYVAGLTAIPGTFGTLSISSGSNAAAYLASAADPAALAATVPVAWAGVELSPNPAHGVATVRVPAVAGASEVLFTLCDALGRVVRTQQSPLPATGITADLPLTGLTPGFYHVLVQAGAQRVARALAVE